MGWQIDERPVWTAWQRILTPPPPLSPPLYYALSFSTFFFFFSFSFFYTETKQINFIISLTHSLSDILHHCHLFSLNIQYSSSPCLFGAPPSGTWHLYARDTWMPRRNPQLSLSGRPPGWLQTLINHLLCDLCLSACWMAWPYRLLPCIIFAFPSVINFWLKPWDTVMHAYMQRHYTIHIHANIRQ